MTLAIDERDLALAARLYRMTLSARALEHDLRRNHEMARMLIEAADVAADLAQAHTEHALFLLTVEGR